MKMPALRTISNFSESQVPISQPAKKGTQDAQT